MSEKHYTKSPTSFLLNRFSLNKLTQNGTKKRIEKEIVYFKDDDTTTNGEKTPKPHKPGEFVPDPYQGSDFHGNNQGTDGTVDDNKSRTDGRSVAMASTNAKLRIVTPGANGFGCQGGFYIAPSFRNGPSASSGLSSAMTNTIIDETLQLDKATFLKVACGVTPTIRAFKTASPSTHKFYTLKAFSSENEYVQWTDGASTSEDVVYTSKLAYGKDAVIYSDNALATAVGHIDACYVDNLYGELPLTSPILAGFFRSLELDETVSGTKYYGWIYIGSPYDSDFAQVYTTKEVPDANDPIFLRDTATGTPVQFPAAFKAVTWSAPASMFDVDYEFDYTPMVSDDILTPGKNVALAESNDDVIPIHIKPASNHFHYNLRALLYGFDYEYLVKQITVTDGQETPTTIGTFDYDGPLTESPKSAIRWKNTATSPAVEYVYTEERGVAVKAPVFSDTQCQTSVGSVSVVTFNTTPEEKFVYTGFAAPTGNWSDPDYLYTTMTPDYTSAKRRTMVLDEYQGINLTPYITKSYWQTANLGYGEVSSQTTLYTETVFRYKDLDAHLSQYLPADWEGSAYGCLIYADSSYDQEYEQMFFGISHSDFFADGSDVYYIIPTNTVGTAGQNGPYDLVHSYVYDASMRSIYGTTFAIDTTVSGNTTTHHYISDATGNYQKDGAWRYHYACVEDKTKDIWATRLAYDFTDLYYLDNGHEIPLNAATQTLVTPITLPYATIFDDNTSRNEGICAWYDFVHRDVASVSSITFSHSGSSLTAERINNNDVDGPDYITDNATTAVTYQRNHGADFTVLATITVGDVVYTRDSDEDKIESKGAPELHMYAWKHEDLETGGITRVYSTLESPVIDDAVYSFNEEQGWTKVEYPVSAVTSSYQRFGWIANSNNFYTANEYPSVGDTIYNDSFEAITAKVASYTLPVTMYAWETFIEGSGWTFFYTNTLTPVANSTHVWSVNDSSLWVDDGAITAVNTTTTTWYRFHTSVKESYTAGLLTAERFKVIWTTARDFQDYHENLMVNSNYDVNDPEVPTTPNINSTIDYVTSYKCYIAPAYEMEVTYQNEDWTFHTDFSSHSYEFKGILYSRWICEEEGGPTDVLYTARITPRVGDKLYVNNGKATAVATDFTIKSVTSVVDFIYPGRA